MNNKEKREILVKYFLNKEGIIDISGIDLSGYEFDADNLKADKISQCNQKAEIIRQNNHEAEEIWQSYHKANKCIFQTNHESRFLRQDKQKADQIVPTSLWGYQKTKEGYYAKNEITE